MGSLVGIDSEALADLSPLIEPVAERFTAAGHRLYLVGGIVRDLALGRPSGFDIDLTTDAEPRTIKSLVAPLAEHVWTQGERFGTIGAQINGRTLEITTHRAERYDPASRKPIVTFGDQLDEDLSRRDFTINAMAIEVPVGTLHDPYGGAHDLQAGVLRTPLSPEVSFNDDPLRMMRAARFISRLDLTVDQDLIRAATELAPRLAIVSTERLRDELERLLAVDDPSAGLGFLIESGLLDHAVQPMTADDATVAAALAAAPGSPLVRRAGLLWPAEAAAVLTRLRYSNQDRRDTVALVESVRNWVDHDLASAADARRLLSRIHVDPARELARNLAESNEISPRSRVAADRLVEALNGLEEAADLGPYDSPLSGNDIMALLAVEPGPLIGRAQKMLRQHRLDHGPFDATEAGEILRRWHHDISP